MTLDFTKRGARYLAIGGLLFGMSALSANIANAGKTVTREMATLDTKYPIGSIVIDTAGRNLYYALGNGHAIKYRVAVGKAGFQWFGQSFVQRKRKNPGWSPTARMRRMGYPRYVPPGPRNPLGVRAIYLGWTEYRIHGTTAPSSIGRAASSGCIRMHNKDVVDLFERVHIGAPVYVLKTLKVASPKTAMNY
ncbi:MAG: L,D-transpeptidase [Hyphomicrobiales bacterium]|nr:L,D-transpeptidase [Hyphomicrobiales bacterium]